MLRVLLMLSSITVY